MFSETSRTGPLTTDPYDYCTCDILHGDPKNHTISQIKLNQQTKLCADAAEHVLADNMQLYEH